MVLPEGKTEKEVLDAIELVVAELANSWAFGYYGVDDIEQEIRLFCLKSLPKYDNLRPLANFFYVVASSRLHNLKRNKLRRSDAPCKKCHNGNWCNNGKACEKYTSWRKRNDAKASSMRPVNIEDHDCETRDVNVAENTERQEMFDKIDQELPVELRAVYLQMKEGTNVPRDKRDEVLVAIREILNV